MPSHQQPIPRPWFLDLILPALVVLLITSHVLALVYWIYRLATEKQPQVIVWANVFLPFSTEKSTNLMLLIYALTRLDPLFEGCIDYIFPDELALEPNTNGKSRKSLQMKIEYYHSCRKDLIMMPFCYVSSYRKNYGSRFPFLAEMSPASHPLLTLGLLTRRDTEVKLPRSTRVKNKTAAPIQITAEQILREARQRQENHRPPKQKITDSDELADYRLRKRKEFEDVIRRARRNTGTWVKYASWEESQGDLARARSIWERLLDVDYRNPTLWLKYAEMEMRHRFINHARNVWDRAVALLPRVDQLWYKYIHMVEILGDVAAARQIFERWMDWKPDTQGWLSYIKFELRYDEVDRARAIYERLVVCHPRPSYFIKYAKFEAKRREIARARAVYERAIDLNLSEDDVEAEQLFVAFAGFEMWCKETERARCIYRYALDHVPKGRAKDLYHEYDAFEKQYGDTAAMEDAIIVRKRKLKSDDDEEEEEQVRRKPLNYDSLLEAAYIWKKQKLAADI
ncbi:hypothetical protein ZIOFF_017031 [Zingiber officinale]|uniref:Pre-mRNA-splicing factor Syf1/CRNKL1-like C-terminal HAT-repeats domain-containing protein n=2 Tax=Zingiber officinale TaxID=94328 RepID=A0A8J5L9Z6_ZINOF|nr:hypothetical protein ZIOFF_017031 [Zingiber officinale]